MKVSVPAWAPTIPPDMGASTKWAWFAGKALETRDATDWEVEGSIVEQSMKRRGLGRVEGEDSSTEV